MQTAVFPVMMHSFNSSLRKKAAKRKEAAERMNREIGNGATKSTVASAEMTTATAGEDLNFLVMSIAHSTVPDSSTVIYKYVAFRMLELKIEVDSSTLQLYFCDLHSDLVGESIDQARAREQPGEWIAEFSARTVIPEARIQLVDIAAAKEGALAPKMYFDNLILHPIKITLSYMPTPFPRSSAQDVFSAPAYRWLKIVKSVMAVDDFSIKLKSFIVNDMTESPASLASRLVNVYSDDLKKHLMSIAGRLFGSLKMLGKPVGLYKNIGGGVKDFFYEVTFSACLY